MLKARAALAARALAAMSNKQARENFMSPDAKARQAGEGKRVLPSTLPCRSGPWDRGVTAAQRWQVTHFFCKRAVPARPLRHESITVRRCPNGRVFLRAHSQR